MPKNSGAAAAWERQQGESPQAFEAFSIYRDLGPERSLRAVVQKCNKSVSLIGRWSSKWKWAERAREYDNSVQQEAYKKAVKGVSEMQTRHIKTAVLMQKRAVEALDKLDIGELSPQDILRFIKEGSKLEADTRGADPAFAAQERREAEQERTSSLADVIVGAYRRRKEGNDV